MDKEKFNAVIEQFKDLPTEVYNAIHDVFEENDSIDEVVAYSKEDKELFEKDITIENTIKMYLNGRNTGENVDVFTYFGNIYYAVSQKVVLYKDDETEEVIQEIMDDNNFQNDRSISELLDPENYAVILFEKLKWDSAKESSQRTLVLHIYFPGDWED